MTFLVPIVLFGWIPVVLLIFAILPARRAVIAGFVVAWCFLPMAGLRVPGIPDFGKQTATAIGVLLGVAIFDGVRLLGFRPRLIDLPILLWCLVPLASCITAGYGAYEGASLAFSRTLAWGVPYLMGRLYFADLAGMRELAMGLIMGGLVYVPLCLYEVRMSPQLHTMVYGFYQHDFGQTLRDGGWRPTVFMQHGLAVSMFMATSTLLAYWLWARGRLTKVMGVPALLAAAAIGVTAVLCRSVGPVVLGFVGMGALWAASRVRWRIVLLALVGLPTLYALTRTFGGWSGQELVSAAGALFGEGRAESLAFRFDSETRMWNFAQPKLLLGEGRFVFGGWIDEETRGVVPDGFWLIALACNGLVGLSAFLALMAVPVLAFVRRFPAWAWSTPAVAPAAAWAVVVSLYGIDCLFNAMENPCLVLAIGGLAAMRLPASTPATKAPTPTASSPARPWFASPARTPAGGPMA